MSTVNADLKDDALADLHRLHQRKRPTFLIRLAWRIEDTIADIRWMHLGYKTLAYSYLAFMFWILWRVLPIPGHWPGFESGRSDRVSIAYQDFSNYFGQFEGFAECNIRARDLYILPPRDEHGRFEVNAFCPNRKILLEALSDGGRIGFDAPYQPKDCAYRWYSVDEICFILERFDALIFVGDSTLQSIYNGLNILLRQDLAAGSLKSWEMDHDTRDQCRCNSQFTTPSCAEHFVTSSEEISDNPSSVGSPYFCQRTPHAILHIDSSPVSEETVSKFKSLVPQAARSKYKPIPIIHSLSPTHFSQTAENRSLLEFLHLADESQRKTPMLWIGPNAAGHIEIKDRKEDFEVWAYDRDMANVATENDIEILKMHNMTAQANSYDGVTFGERVAITQAMMVVNWLSRLESS